MSTSSEDRARARFAITAARENVDLIRTWAAATTLEAIKADVQVRYAIERAFIAIDSAIRDLPEAIVSEHALPANLISGFRNALAHTYDDILDERVILTIREDLPALDTQLAAILRALE